MGDDLAVAYQIHGPGGFSFDTVELHVYNASDVLVYKQSDLDTSVGEHRRDTAEFSNITPADLDNDPATQQILDALVRQTMAAGLADGSYHVVIKRLRDKAGNVGGDGYPASGDVSVINDWTIRMY